MTNQRQFDNHINRGNAVHEAAQGTGWIIGHFIPKEKGLQCDKDVEVKWGEHTKGDCREKIGISDTSTTLTLLVYGKYEVHFPDFDRHITLSERGDYVIYGPGVGHTWEVFEKSLLITVRWPLSMSGSHI